MLQAMEELATAYEALNSHAAIEVRGGDSSAGLADLQAGQAELAAVSWHAGDAAVPAGLQALPIGRDAIAMIVHPSNPVRGLTLLQIKSIYQGEILDWTGLGGDPLEPAIISREDGSGTRAAFETLVVGGERVTLNALVMPSSQAVVDYVAAHRTAIGYVSAAWLDERVRALAVEGTAPTAANLRAGAYHLSRGWYLYAPVPAPPATQAFLDFVLSAPGQAIVNKYGVGIW